jgi:hypothetical protein
MQTETNLLSVLTREGVLINVSVRYWRGCKKLKPEDIGIDPGNLSDRLISLGHKRLLPREATAALGLIESRAHALIDSNTFPFLGGLAHFVPNSKLQEITGKLDQFEREFWKAKEEFIRRYGALRESASREWRQMAEKLVHDPERLVATIENSFPRVDQMDRFFGFNTHLFQIAAPERLGLDLVTLADQQGIMNARQEAARAAARKIQENVQSFIAECAATLREQTAALCDEMLASIQTCETGVHQKTLNRLVRFIDQFKEMNFVNDTVMEERLERVRRELLSRTAEQYRDSRSAQEQLVRGLAQLRDHARQLAKTDAAELVQRFGAMGRRKFHLAA